MSATPTARRSARRDTKSDARARSALAVRLRSVVTAGADSPRGRATDPTHRRATSRAACRSARAGCAPRRSGIPASPRGCVPRRRSDRKTAYRRDRRPADNDRSDRARSRIRRRGRSGNRAHREDPHRDSRRSPEAPDRDSPARARSGTERRARRSDTRTPRNRRAPAALRRPGRAAAGIRPTTRAMPARSSGRVDRGRPPRSPEPEARSRRSQCPAGARKRRRARRREPIGSGPPGATGRERRFRVRGEGSRLHPFRRDRQSTWMDPVALHGPRLDRPRQIDAAAGPLPSTFRNCSARVRRVA